MSLYEQNHNHEGRVFKNAVKIRAQRKTIHKFHHEEHEGFYLHALHGNSF
jgi:hypothetical protein